MGIGEIILLFINENLLSSFRFSKSLNGTHCQIIFLVWLCSWTVQFHFVDYDPETNTVFFFHFHMISPSKSLIQDILEQANWRPLPLLFSSVAQPPPLPRSLPCMREWGSRRGNFNVADLYLSFIMKLSSFSLLLSTYHWPLYVNFYMYSFVLRLVLNKSILNSSM